MTKKIVKTEDAIVTVYFDAPNWDGKPAAAFGEFSCKTFESGTEVIDLAISLVRSKGIDRIIGPMNGDTWHSYRFVSETDGSTPFLLEPTNEPHVLDVFISAGFANISEYFSARVPLDQTAQTIPTPTSEFMIEHWDGKDPRAMFKKVYNLSSKAFSKNVFYKPITQDEFLEMYMPIVPMIKPELIFFALRPDKSLVGFLFGIPNYAEGPAPKTVILKTYASLVKGAGQHLAYAFHSAALDSGYKTAIHALIHEDNLSGLRSAAEGAEIFRRYKLMGLQLDD